MNYELTLVPRIVSAAGRLSAIGRDARELIGGTGLVLIVADSGLQKFGQIDQAQTALEQMGHEVAICAEISGEPRTRNVESALKAARAVSPEVIVCLGGGSAIDVGKLVACLVGTSEPIGAFELNARPLPRRIVHLIAVPTTAGTGSEATSTSVIKRGDDAKVWYWSPAMKPDLIVLDPLLTMSLPPELTAATGLDAWVHAVEAATNNRAIPANSRRALDCVQVIGKYLPQAVRSPDDLSVRSELQWASTAAGIAIDNSGTALAHAIGHGLASLIPIHHGRAVALAMAATLPFAIAGNQSGFRTVAEAMNLNSEDDLTSGFLQFADEVGLDFRLPAASSLSAALLAERIAAPENQPMLAATARPVTNDDVLHLAKLTLGLTAGSYAA